MRWMAVKIAGVAAAVSLFAGSAPADEQAAPVQKSFVALVKAGPVDDALVERERAWARDSLAVSMPVLPAMEWTFESLDQAGSAAAKLLKEGDLGVVVLAWPEHELSGHGVSMLEDRVVVVNVRAMKTEGADDETVARRVDRQVMKAIGLLAGMDFCPNVMCSLTRYGTMEGLDAIGRNYCPPCAMRFQNKMQDQHIPLDPNSPFYLLAPQGP